MTCKETEWLTERGEDVMYLKQEKLCYDPLFVSFVQNPVNKFIFLRIQDCSPGIEMFLTSQSQVVSDIHSFQITVHVPSNVVSAKQKKGFENFDTTR